MGWELAGQNSGQLRQKLMLYSGGRISSSGKSVLFIGLSADWWRPTHVIQDYVLHWKSTDMQMLATSTKYFHNSSTWVFDGKPGYYTPAKWYRKLSYPAGIVCLFVIFLFLWLAYASYVFSPATLLRASNCFPHHCLHIWTEALLMCNQISGLGNSFHNSPSPGRFSLNFG